jgi:hypothetical protein
VKKGNVIEAKEQINNEATDNNEEVKESSTLAMILIALT